MDNVFDPICNALKSKEWNNIVEQTIVLFNDKNKAINWLYSSNDYFFKQSPFQFFLENGEDSVLNLLRARAGEIPYATY